MGLDKFVIIHIRWEVHGVKNNKTRKQTPPGTVVISTLREIASLFRNRRRRAMIGFNRESGTSRFQ